MGSVSGESDGERVEDSRTPEQQEEEGGGEGEETEQEEGEDGVSSAHEEEEKEAEQPTEEPDDVPTFTEFSQRKRMEQNTSRQRPAAGQLLLSWGWEREGGREGRREGIV